MGADREVVMAAAPQEHAKPAACANCGEPVSGRFCSNCGQRLDHAVHSVWHFAGEAVEDLTHADSRLWSTLGALLFKPGFLTCEFLAGRRVKYLPPLRLYLVLSLLFFVVAALGRVGGEVTVLVVPQDGSRGLPALPVPLDAKNSEEACNTLATHGVLGRLLSEGCHKAVKDKGRALTETYKHNIPRAIFLSLPLLALALKPLYRRYYVEHLLFLLHNHAFIFLWFTAYNLICLLIPSSPVQEGLFFVFLLYVPYYYFRAMRQVYGEVAGLTIGKFSVVSFAYFIVGALLFLATGMYSVLEQAA
jgi:Protein of unknown function (DUF3667)